MVAQRGAGVSAHGGVATGANSGARKGGKDAEKSAARSASSGGEARKRRLSFKEKHALETLPGRIAELEAQITKVQAVMDDPELFRRDPARFEAATAKLGELQLALNQAEEQWLELEMLREELEG